MRWIAGALLSLVTLAGAATGAAADGLVLSLSPTVDLSALRVGVPFSLEVRLEGLTTETLDALAGSVLFDATLLGGATLPMPGATLPDAAAFAGAVTGASVAGAFARAQGGDPILRNGLFYAFTLTPTARGSGAFGFDTLSLLATATGSPERVFPQAGPDLGFTVIPEPSVALLLAAGLVVLGGLYRAS